MNKVIPKRRDFLKTVGLAGAAGLLKPSLTFSDMLDAKSRIIIVEDNKATTGNKINTSVVQIMVDEGIKSLTQLNDVGEAWKSLFAGVNSASKIGIKVNCINSALSSHPEVAFAIANGLKKMMFDGTPFNENNIIIYERTEYEMKAAKYTINKSSSGVRVVATDSSGIGYSSTTWTVDGSVQKISKVVTEMVDFFINLAVLKNHGSPGVTLCLKNHLGTCHNPGGTGGIHDGDINKKIAELNTVPPIKSKQKVFIIDALYGIRSGGPGGSPQFAANKLIMGTDIVAVDYNGKDLLAKNGCTSTNYASHIALAATAYSLGTNDPSKMDIINIINPSAIESGISLTSPNGGEILDGNSKFNITWVSQKISNVKLEFSSDNGANWNSIIDSLPDTPSSYSWNVPNIDSDKCKIRASDASNSNDRDESNTVFTINSAKTVRVISPNGGEKWEVGKINKITWYSSKAVSLNIEFSFNDGTNWMPVNYVMASDLVLSWKVPDYVSKKCKIKITDGVDSSIFDISDNNFEIIPAPNLIADDDIKSMLEIIPNPLSHRATIKFNLEKPSKLRLELVSLTGYVEDLIYNGFYPAGEHNFEFNASAIPTGVYFVKLTSDNKTLTVKCLIAK